jgi:hypothetical protein
VKRAAHLCRRKAPACGSAGLGDQHAYRQPAVDPAEERRPARQLCVSGNRADPRGRRIFRHGAVDDPASLYATV